MNCQGNNVLIFADTGVKGEQAGSYDFESPIKITGFIGDFVRSVQSLGLNRIVTITENGILSVCTYNAAKKKGKIKKFFKMKLPLDEEISCMRVSRDGAYLAVASSYNLKNSKIFLFKVIEMELKLVKKKDLSKEIYSKTELSFFQDLNLDYNVRGMPVILGFQYDADNLVVPLAYNGYDVCYLSEPRVFHSNVFCKTSFRHVGGSLWSIDKNGTLKKLYRKRE